MDITPDEIIELLEQEADSDKRRKLRATAPPTSVFDELSPEIDEALTSVYEALDYLTDLDDEILLYAYTLINSGTCTGKEMTRRFFVSEVNKIACAMNDRLIDPNWDRTVTTGEALRARLIQAWCTGNVVEEIGAEHTLLELLGFETLGGFLSTWRGRLGERGAVQTDVHYWRGIAILAVTEAVPPFSIPPECSDEFMDWAPNQPDLVDIIKLVKERGVLTPDTVRGVLNQKSVHSSLRSGVL